MNLLNAQQGVYPEINDPDFYRKIYNKKEFADNMIENREKDIHCLEPQQRFLSNFINPLTRYNSILIYHSVGVGKTLTAISIAEKFKNDYSIMVLVKNKLLESNFRKELISNCSNYLKPSDRQLYYSKEYSTLDESNELRKSVSREINKHYSIITYGSLVNSTSNTLEIKRKHLNNTLLIIDEVHNVTSNDAYTAIIQLLRNSYNVKVVLLSATPVYDNIKEAFEIANLLGDILPIRNDLLKNKLIKQSPTQAKTSELTLANTVSYLTSTGKKVLAESLRGKVSYLTSDPKFFPERILAGASISNRNGSTKIVRSVMSEFQEQGYNKTLMSDNNTLFNNSSNALTIIYPDGNYGKVGYEKNITKNKDNSFLKKENIKKYSCKLYVILSEIENAKGPVFIYSNFVNNGGTSLLMKTLNANGYSRYSRLKKGANKYIILDDTVSDSVKQNNLRALNDNSNKYGENIKIIIGSPVVSEGITFKNIRQIHILEPSWNLSRIEQIIGRGARFRSHQALPESERSVDIFLHCAMTRGAKSIKSPEPGASIDYLKYYLSEDKDIVIKEFESLAKKIAVDCYQNKSRNLQPKSKDYSRECQYDVCAYTCPYEPKTKTKRDKSTYSLTSHDYEKYLFIYEKINDLYKIGYMYDINHISDYINSKSESSISKKNIYFVLNHVMSEGVIAPNNYKAKIIKAGKYYIATPESVDIDEQFFYRLYPKMDKVSKDLYEVITGAPLYVPIKHAKQKKSDGKVYTSELHGIVDEVGNFKIVIPDPKQSTTDKRKINRGKLCIYFTANELKDIAKTLGITVTKTGKKELCSNIKSAFKKANKLIDN